MYAETGPLSLAKKKRETTKKPLMSDDFPGRKCDIRDEKREMYIRPEIESKVVVKP